jgi:DNA-binding YbaB/EbfC family protein
MFNKLKQFKDIRSRAKAFQDALSQESAEGSGGWGKVKIVMDGNMKAKTVTIDPSLLSNKSACESTVREAMNDAIEKIQKLMASKMKDLGGNDLAKDVQDLMKK